MDIYAVRQELRTKSIYDLPLRVTFYARVSTDSDEQKNSIENQTAYYVDFITKNKNWTFVPPYIDEGLSGATTKKRESFNRMIDDARDGRFDFIITKEISRFARNTLDSIRYTRELLSYGVCVFFQGDNINTIDEDSEMRLTIMSSIAQDELRKLSSRVKFGHQQAIKSGVVLGNSRIFGYTKKDKRLIVDEQEAALIRELFELYATDQYSLKQLETIFYEKGYRNHNGHRIAHNTLSNILSNPKYKGYYVGNKVKVMDIFTKKQKFLSPDEWVMYKDETGEIVPSIVSEELWDAANLILQRRSSDVKQRQNKCTHGNLLTGKLYCAHCGAYYYRKDSQYKGHSCSRWVCSGKLKNGADTCDSFALTEKDIKSLIFSVFTDTYKDADKYIDEYLAMYRETYTATVDDQIEALRGEIDLSEKKKEKLLGFNVKGELSDTDFLKMYKKCEQDIVDAKSKLEELIAEQNSLSQSENEIRQIKHLLQQAVADIGSNADIDPAFINKYIKNIIITPISSTEMQLDIQIFTGDYLEKYLIRSGNMRKKMIEAYENGMK